MRKRSKKLTQKEVNQLFLRSSESGDIDRARHLISRGANPNTRDNELKDALYFAAINNHYDFIDFLIRETKIDFKDNKSDLAYYYYLIKSNNIAMFKKLLDIGVTKDSDVFPEAIVYFIFLAAIEQSLDMANFLNITKLDVNSCDEKGNTALHMAAELLHYDAFRSLVIVGADINKSSKEGITPLMRIVGKEDLDISKIVQLANLAIECGANINSDISNLYGHSPLMCAVGANNLQAIKFLLDNGADISERTNLGDDILSMAYRGKDHGVINLVMNQAIHFRKRELTILDRLDQSNKLEKHFDLGDSIIRGFCSYMVDRLIDISKEDSGQEQKSESRSTPSGLVSIEDATNLAKIIDLIQGARQI